MLANSLKGKFLVLVLGLGLALSTVGGARALRGQIHDPQSSLGQARFEERLSDVTARFQRWFQAAAQDFSGASQLSQVQAQAMAGQVINLRDDGSRYVIEVALPNQGAPEIRVAVQGQELLISSCVSDYLKAHLSCNQGQMIMLPQTVDADALKTERQNDRLLISVPKNATTPSGSKRILNDKDPPLKAKHPTWFFT